jgi:hypothetical protein
MKKYLFAFAALALLAEPVAVSAAPVRMTTQDAIVGVQPTRTVTAAGAAHRSTRRTARRVTRRR